MAKGNEIIVSANARGRRSECVISGTPKPGTVMQIDAAVEPVGGRFTYEVYAPGTDGDQRVIAVLLANSLFGGIATTAYADGDRGYLYFPMAGDELNMILEDVAGTGDTHAIGDVLIVDTGTGTLIDTTGTPEAEPFICLETMTAGTADVLAWCQFTGY